MLTHLTGQPQPRLDHHRQCHPHDAALGLDAYLIGLHLAEVSWVLHQMRLDSLALAAGARAPRCHGAFIEPKGDDNRLQRTAVRHERNDKGHRLRRSPQAVKRGACRRGECLGARRAQEPFVLARVETNIALACLTSGRALQIGAEDSGGVHDDSPLLALLGSMPRKNMSGPPFSSQANLTTV